MSVSVAQLRQNFRRLLKAKACYDTASVFDPMSARIAHELGFEMGILGGSVASLQVLAAPDFALITLTEFAEQATRIGRVAQLPMIADADHGYGNALNARRTVQELERAGVAMLTLEDTLLPVQYQRKSTDLVSIGEMSGKLAAACAARTDEQLSIFARTQVGAQNEEMLYARLESYQKTPIDGICLAGVRDMAHLESIRAHVDLPLMLIAYNNPQLLDLEQLAHLGVRIIVNGHAAYFAAIKAIYDCLRQQRGVCTNDLDASALSAHYSNLEEYRQWAKAYMHVEQ